MIILLIILLWYLTLCLWLLCLCFLGSTENPGAWLCMDLRVAWSSRRMSLWYVTRGLGVFIHCYFLYLVTYQWFILEIYWTTNKCGVFLVFRHIAKLGRKLLCSANFNSLMQRILLVFEMWHSTWFGVYSDYFLKIVYLFKWEKWGVTIGIRAGRSVRPGCWVRRVVLCVCDICVKTLSVLLLSYF